MPSPFINFVLYGATAGEKRLPTALAVVDKSFTVAGAVVRFDGRGSTDPNGYPLSFTWTFESVPIGSQVQFDGFTALEVETDSSAPVLNSPSVVSFTTDLVGEYVVGLQVSNGTVVSDKVYVTISVRAIMVPHGRALVPDGKFIWNYIRDVWQQVEGKEWFESLWSALIQMTGAELLKTYQVDFNKSIRDIQDFFQRRWLSYEPRLPLTKSDLSIMLAKGQAGVSAFTPDRLGIVGEAVVLDGTTLSMLGGGVFADSVGRTLKVIRAMQPANMMTYDIAGLVGAKNGYSLKTPVPYPSQERPWPSPVRFIFSPGSKSWTIYAGGGTFPPNYPLTMAETPSVPDLMTSPSLTVLGTLPTMAVGDVIVYKSGPNIGTYRIVSKSGAFIIVDKAPSGSSSLSSPDLGDVYRPVDVEIDSVATPAANWFGVPFAGGANDLSTAVPGELVVVGGRAYEVGFVAVDGSRKVPSTVVKLTTTDVPTGLSNLPWRLAHTLGSSSQDFEALGVAAGDLLLFDLILMDTGSRVEVKAQVVGVTGKKLAFVINEDSISAGSVPEVPNATFVAVSSGLGIESATLNELGSLVLSGLASALNNTVTSLAFQRQYFDKVLSPVWDIVVNGFTFHLEPKAVVRNSRLPVDTTLRSVPLLQEFIKQPEISFSDGKVYQNVRGGQFELARVPQILGENSDFIVDAETALNQLLTFKTGSDVIDADGADFLDRGVLPGDVFVIESPVSLVGEFVVKSVISNEKIVLARPVPLYVTNFSSYTTSLVKVTRKTSGRFLRFVPGSFTASQPAPDRLWAEVSFFDNNDAIEGNFGFMVGLSKTDLDGISSNVTYRQAVSGLMYAYTQGPSVSRVELGLKILLGLPFAEHRGVIHSIDNSFKKTLNGDPTLGRMLIEDIDKAGVPLGTTRVYTYPLDHEATELAGVDTNPATGVAYVVGDTVEAFAPLARGVVVEDSQTAPKSWSSITNLLHRYHSINVRVHDSLIAPSEMPVLSSFLKKITPAYVATFIKSVGEFLDEINVDLNIEDRVTISENFEFIDESLIGVDVPLMFSAPGSPLPTLGTWGDGPFYVRRIGHDLTTTPGTLQVVGTHFLTPRSNETFQGNLCRPGDKLRVLTGPDAGLYEIFSVTDTAISIKGGRSGFVGSTGQTYVIVRPVSYVVRYGSCTFVDGSHVTLGAGLLTDGVAPGDMIVFDATGAVFPTSSFVQSVTATLGVYDTVVLNPAIAASGGTVSNYRVLRKGLNPTRPHTLGTAYVHNSDTRTLAHWRLDSQDASSGLDEAGVANIPSLPTPTIRSVPALTSDGAAATLFDASTPDLLTSTTAGSTAAVASLVGEWTVEAWVRLSPSWPPLPGIVAGIIQFGGFSGNDQLFFGVDTAQKLRVLWEKGSHSAVAAADTTVLPLDTVVHVAARKVHTPFSTPIRFHVDFFVNGVFSSTVAARANTDGGSSSDPWVLGFNFTGAIESVRVTSGQRTDGEIWYSANGGGNPVDPHQGTFELTSDGATPSVLTPLDNALYGLAEPGDEIEVQQTGTRYTIGNFVSWKLLGTLAAGTYNAKLYKRGQRPGGAVNWGQLSYAADALTDVSVNKTTSGNASTAGSTNVITFSGSPDPYVMGAKPNDFLVATSGPNAGPNLGYGTGKLLILSVSAGSIVVHSSGLTASTNFTWNLLKHR